jgi:hypothetical protein
MFFISLFFKMMLLCVLNLPRFSGKFPDDSAKFAHDSAIGAAWFSRPKSHDFGYSSHRRRSRTRERVVAAGASSHPKSHDFGYGINLPTAVSRIFNHCRV